jgi:hypothetical protein
VSAGATEKIRNRRKQRFYEVRLAELLTEAKSLNITKEELIGKIREEK